MKVLLNIIDRFAILDMIPPRGTLLDRIVARDLTRKLDFTQEDIGRFNMKPGPEGKGVVWDAKADSGVELDLTDAEVSLIKRGVEEWDQAGKVTNEYLDTCIKMKEL